MRAAHVVNEEQAMVAFDQPEILEPNADDTGNGAGERAPDDGASASDGGEGDDSEGDDRHSGSGFVPIAVGLAALLPLPSLFQRRC
jgi:hypothetical protein